MRGADFGPALSTVRASTYDEALDLTMDHKCGNGPAIFTRDGDTAWDFATRVNVGMIGINVPFPVRLAYHLFGGWKKSVFGDLIQHGQDDFRTAFGFGQDKIAPHALASEETSTIPREMLREAEKMGFGALYITDDQGGTGLSRLDVTLVFEALAMACHSISAFISIHNMCTSMVAKYGTPVPRENLVLKLAAMECVASYCPTEPDSGSDAAALHTSAVCDGDRHDIVTPRS